jgi:hypothetical protein
MVFPRGDAVASGELSALKKLQHHADVQKMYQALAGTKTRPMRTGLLPILKKVFCAADI